jgi:hypothetical protein
MQLQIYRYLAPIAPRSIIPRPIIVAITAILMAARARAWEIDFPSPTPSQSLSASRSFSPCNNNLYAAPEASAPFVPEYYRITLRTAVPSRNLAFIHCGFTSFGEKSPISRREMLFSMLADP